jgi:hypothetical protein
MALRVAKYAAAAFVGINFLSYLKSKGTELVMARKARRKRATRDAKVVTVPEVS